MSQWVDRVENHPINDRLKQVLTAIEQTEQLPDLTPEEISGIERLKQIHTMFRTRISRIDPVLVPESFLNNADNQINGVLGQLNAFLTDRNPSHMTAADNQADNILSALGGLLSVDGPADLEDLRKAAVSLRRSVSQYHRYVNDERQGLGADINRLKEALKSIESEIGTQKGRLDTAIAEFQKQFSEAEERRRSEHTDSEKNRTDEFQNKQNQHEENFSEKLSSWESSLQTSVEQLDEKAVSFISDLEKNKKRAEELVNIIGMTGMAGGYKKTANEEHTAAVRWRVVAVLSLIGLIGFAIYAFSATLGSGLGLQTFGGRVFAALTFGILASYAARQADRNETAERSSRKLELALASIDPYLLGLPESIQHEIKKDLALKFFGAEEPRDRERQGKVRGSTADLLRMALEALSDLTKKSG